MAGLTKRINYYMSNGDDLEKLSSVELGNRFSNWCLEYIFDKTLTEIETPDIESGVLKIDGCNDGGIDYSFFNNGILYIIQTKYSNSHQKNSFANYLEQVKKLLKKGPEKNQKSELFDVYNCYLNNADEIQIFYITTSKFTSNEMTQYIDYIEMFEEEITNNNKSIHVQCLDIDGIDEYICRLTGEIPPKFKNKKITLLIGKSFINNQNDTLVTEVPIKNIAKFVKDGGDYLYYSNIRNYLGKNKVNKKIIETYNSSPKDFWYYNNGITIVCNDFNIQYLSANNEKANCHITTPQIVNGCQTSKTIEECYKKQCANKQNSQEGTILVKIIKDPNQKRRDSITRFTNSQTAVSGKDFFALDEFHKNLKTRFSQLGYNYEIQKNSQFEKKRHYQGRKEYTYLFDEKFNKECKISAKDIVQNFVAGYHQLPSLARNISNIVPGSNKYDEIFNDKTPEDPKVFLFSYAIMYYSRYVLNHNKDNNKKTTNLMFVSMYFNLIAEILKDYEIIETYSDILSFDPKIIETIESIFINKELNKKLIKMIENAQKFIFRDSQYKKWVGDNLPRFVKNDLDKQHIHDFICDKVKDEYIDNKDELSSDLKEILKK